MEELSPAGLLRWLRARGPGLLYHAGLLGIVGMALWLVRINPLSLLPARLDAALQAGAQPAKVEAATGLWPAGLLPVPMQPPAAVRRIASLHTNIPARLRQDIITYTVQAGDTLFGIAEKYGITPETVLWGNYFFLKDDPHLLRPDQQLFIAPANGVLRVVQAGDTIEGLAKAYLALPEDIINWLGNGLDPDAPKLTAGQMLLVPGGQREFVRWVVPQITRTQRNPLPVGAGPGACPGGYSGGAVGGGFFVWPSNNHFLSGTNFTSYHPGIDIATAYGDPVYAADGGVVVFAGWSNYGYGNMVVIDHGNGWQTLYAHLSQWNVSCGQSSLQQTVVGLAGSTGNSSGPHLHFEMQYGGGRVNPWNYLQ